uniref:Uncharacterized protein n=1 Tax=viral metagenome TaxID=1070528 RepID=A0A6H1ZC52_9ZZZZ
MKRLLVLMIVLGLAGMPCIAGTTLAKNLYVSGPTALTTADATVTFPIGTQAFTIINYDTTNTLEVTYNTQTFEVSPVVGSSISFDDCDFGSITWTAKGTSGETINAALVIAIY